MQPVQRSSRVVDETGSIKIDVVSTATTSSTSSSGSTSSQSRRKKGQMFYMLVFVAFLMVGWMVISALEWEEISESAKPELPQGDSATPLVYSVQRAAYRFLQASAYHMYINNNFARHYEWANFQAMLTAFVELHTALNYDPDCEKTYRQLAQRTANTPAFPPRVFYETTWLDEIAQANSCGFRPRRLVAAEIPEDMQLATQDVWLQRVWRLARPVPLSSVPPRTDLSQVVPFISWRLKTPYTDARLLRQPSVFSLATRLWLELHKAAVHVARHSTDRDKIGHVVDAFRGFFTAVNKLFPCQTCQAHFVAPLDDENFFEFDPSELAEQMLGFDPAEEPNRQEVDCSVSWASRPTSPPSANTAPLPPEQFLIPPRQDTDRKLTVVLDIDETLLFTRRPPLLSRPYLEEFMRGLEREGFEVVFWTAAEQTYATNLLVKVDTHRISKNRVYRDPRWFTHGQRYTKDLRRLGRNMADVVIIENSPSSVWMNKANSILIPDYFYNNEQDGALKEVLDILMDIKNSGEAVPQYIASSPRLLHICPYYSYAAEDDSQPYHGIGDFTN